MRYLKNCWYQAGWSSELTQDVPLARTIAEIPLLIWRDGKVVELPPEDIEITP